MKYKTSTDYERMWELAQDEQIVWRNKLVSSAGEWSSTPKNIKAWAGDKTKFFRYCAEFGIEFIDPASQQHAKKFDCIANMPLEDAIKHIPGGARINTEECFAESLSFDCNGESIHEHWGEGVTPAAAVLKLYERAKRAECGIEKTPAELAAGEMVELLNKCDSCINYLIHGVVDDPVIGEAENTLIEIKEVLKKARGEA